ncbi:MAG TPA: TIGR04211 family SH3 domain-containing protein [Gammaproteobacteria bacterium]|nr:TIGR04211 family SH3 domain-containing protein [Gammaproteobacteria bacterium]
MRLFTRALTVSIFYLAALSALAQTPAAPTAPTAQSAPVPSGQKAYISDRLNLGLYLQPDPASTPIKSLPSGMQVQILESRDGFARIRMIDGNEGWARAEFITAEPPAKVLLQQVTRERDQLRDQLSAETSGAKQLTTQLAQAHQKIQQLEQQLANPQSSSESTGEYQLRYQQSQQKITELERQLENKAGQKPADNLAIKILGLLATLTMSIGLGALLGARWLGARVRRRFNGLKVW